MKDLIQELIPHAPQMGLYVVPHIPEDKMRNALRDYARSMKPEEVLALYDATLLGSAKDGAVFAEDRFVFQNNDLEAIQEVRYVDIVQVGKKRGFLKGAKVQLSVNRGRATFDLTLDCSAHPQAMEFIHRFLHEAMLHPSLMRGDATPYSGEPVAGRTDVDAVREALDQLREQGLLADDDYRRMLDVLR